jgi:hypothetical protein
MEPARSSPVSSCPNSDTNRATMSAAGVCYNTDHGSEVLLYAACSVYNDSNVSSPVDSVYETVPDDSVYNISAYASVPVDSAYDNSTYETVPDDSVYETVDSSDIDSNARHVSNMVGVKIGI